jgi:predicted AAA+ superfamily ATPase
MNVQRAIVASIIELLGKYPVVALTGPRQSGKTTLLKNAFPNYSYVSLEKPDVREFATKDPNAFLKQLLTILEKWANLFYRALRTSN